MEVEDINLRQTDLFKYCFSLNFNSFRSSKLLPRILGSAKKKYEMASKSREPTVEEVEKEEDTEAIISEILNETKGYEK